MGVVGFAFDDHVLDAARRELRRNGIVVPVEPQVFDLLLYLIENRERVVSKEDIYGAVWKGRFVSESTLTSRINAARMALGDSGAVQRLIRTIPRKGFRFVSEVTDGGRGFSAPLPAQAATPDTAIPEPVPFHRPAIAVLPFANMGGDPEQEYFADGMTEDIITALSKWRSFLVTARNSSFAYRGRNVDVRDVGRELGVRYVLEGSVRKSGSRLRITAQLIATADATHVWAERYDRELVDVFAVQDEISQRIAAIIEPEMGRHEQLRATAKPTGNLEAWDCLNRGLQLLYRFNRKDNEAARVWFERAVALDPAFSRAHASLAYTHQQDVLHAYTTNRTRSIERHLESARRAVQLDEADSYAHVMLAFGHRWNREHDLTIAEARKAIECNPSDAWAIAMLGLALDLAGQHREGASEMERAMALNPRDPHRKFYIALIARAYLASRDHATAEIWARQAVENDGENPRSFLLLAVALGHLGRISEARIALNAAHRLNADFAKQWLAAREYREDADNQHIAAGLGKAGLS
jgi:TolB-like protein/Tfp pilus assembly protein PilF